MKENPHGTNSWLLQSSRERSEHRILGDLGGKKFGLIVDFHQAQPVRGRRLSRLSSVPAGQYVPDV